jgi:hypothetical protein
MKKPQIPQPPLPEAPPPEVVRAEARTIAAATARYLADAPKEARERAQAIIKEATAVGGWSPEDWRHWRVLQSILLYAEYCAGGESVILEKLPPVVQLDPQFFRTEWWIAALIQRWKTEGAEGRRKVKGLAKRHAGEKETHQQRAARLARNLKIVSEVEKRIKVSRDRQIKNLEYEIKSLGIDEKNDPLRNRLFDRLAALHDRHTHPSGIRLTEIFKEVAADHADESLSWFAIRKIYQEHLKQRTRHTTSARGKRGFGV